MAIIYNSTNSLDLYYPKNNVCIRNSNTYKEIFTTITCDKKVCLMNVYCYNKRIYPGIQLVLGFKNKDSTIYSELLSALKEINNGEREYKIPEKVCHKIIKAIFMKSCINRINTSKYADFYEYLFFGEKMLLKLINKIMVTLIFIFYRC